MNGHSQHSNQTTMSNVLLPDEVIFEILSFLPVKSLLQFTSVCKSWKTLISEPAFIKLHLKRSPKAPQIALISYVDSSILPLPIHDLLDTTTTSITLPNPNHSQFNQILGLANLNIVGSSNGLLCLLGHFFSNQILLYLWNPATAKLSNKIVFLTTYESVPSNEFFSNPPFRSWKFAFGYDNSTDTYKIVALNPMSNKVKVYNFGYVVNFYDDDGTGWRSIQNFPLIPLDNTYQGISNSVHVSGTLNWLAIRDDRPQSDYEYDWNVITIDQFVLVSLDLSTETYTHFLLPRGFEEVPHLEPSLVVLMDSLCFCHDFHETGLVIWQMKKFGVEDSWTRFLKISYQSFSYDFPLVLYPLCLSENGDTLILACKRDEWVRDEHAILYSLRDGKVKITSTIIYNYNLRDGNIFKINRRVLHNLGENSKTRVINGIQWHLAKNYFESLVSTG